MPSLFGCIVCLCNCLFRKTLMAKELKIAVIGFGTVGTGVVKCLQQNQDLIAARTGVRPVLSRIVSRDLVRDRGVQVDSSLLTTDIEATICDPEIDVVVELIGGETVAKDLILRALNNGKAVVTANKSLLAYHGKELFDAAEANDTDIYYEASTAGGIPIIKSLREGLAANNIKSIYGILNGTCNYILTRMENEGVSYSEVLSDAQELGYAEAEPSLDVDGFDAAHKTVILASLAYGSWFSMDDIKVEGIRDLKLEDIKNADALGYRIKHLGVIKLNGNQPEIRVHPALIPKTAMLSNVNEVYNAVCVYGDMVGNTMFYGPGAGQDATASAVVADIIDVCLNLKRAVPNRVPGFLPHDNYDSEVVAIENIQTRYYLRMSLRNEANVLAKITSILGRNDISIASISQTEEDGEFASVIFITHKTTEGQMSTALADIKELREVKDEFIKIKIEDLK